MAERKHFLGTYFDRSLVLKLSGWANMLAWAILVSYIIETAYNTFFPIYQNYLSGYEYGLDAIFMLFQLIRVFQGAMLFVILRGFGQLLLMVMEIEENTRAANRND